MALLGHSKAMRVVGGLLALSILMIQTVISIARCFASTILKKFQEGEMVERYRWLVRLAVLWCSWEFSFHHRGLCRRAAIALNKL